MSAADIGRKKIEPQEAELIAVGARVLDPNGREYEVVNLGEPGDDSVVELHLQPIGQCGSKPFRFKRDEPIRVRR